MSKKGYVYILASQRNGTLYIGVTSNLIQRMEQHKIGTVKGFSSEYNVKQLVYYEVFDDIAAAISREKAMKKWSRSWKIEAIEKANPDWIEIVAENIS